MKKKPEAKDPIRQALSKLQEITGLKVRSYTVYPGKGTLKANITIEARGGTAEIRSSEGLRKL